jgi:HJR/Mrr/RecB family endonuclease
MARRRNRKSEQMGLPLLLFVGLQAFLVYRLPGYGAVFGALCILAAGLAILFIGQLRRRAIRRWQSIGSLYALSQTDFERHVAETYRYLGYATEMTPRVGDQGVDILAQRHRCRLAVQCKRYADPAPNSAVQAVHAGKTHYGCNEATVICLGGAPGPVFRPGIIVE